MVEFPALRQTVLDTRDARELAEFYRELLGATYRRGDEPPPPDQPDVNGQDWLVLRLPGGGNLAFQQEPDARPSTWPDNVTVPMQLHLDLVVPTVADLDAQHERVLSLGGTLRYDRADDAEEPLRVYADPAGHPFCIFVAP